MGYRKHRIESLGDRVALQSMLEGVVRIVIYVYTLTTALLVFVKTTKKHAAIAVICAILILLSIIYGLAVTVEVTIRLWNVPGFKMYHSVFYFIIMILFLLIFLLLWREL